MEDVQDGIRVSIQDGVEEDPTEVEKYILAGRSFAGLIAVTEQMANPQITTEVNATTDAIKKTAIIATVLETNVV